MSKIYAFLATVWFLIISLSINAQPTFYFSPSDLTPDPGEQITVDVLVDGFTDIISYQYSVNWDTDYLGYASISNFNPELGLSAGNFGTNNTGNGTLSTLWADPFANPQTIADGSILFTITFDVVATGAVSTDVQFTGNPTGLEVIQDTGNGLEDVTSLTTFEDVTIDIGGGGPGGPGPICNFNGFGLVVESDSAMTGEQVCLDVAACNFTDILSMQYTMQFDPTIIQFDNVGNFNLQDLSSGNFGTTMTNNGFVTVSWNDLMGQGVTVPDETVIYSICFTAIGPGGSIDTVKINSSLAQIEVTDINSGGSNIGLESIDGEVKITGDVSNAVSVIAECDSGEPGDTVYVDISVANFTDMVGLQYSMSWDPDIISFYETQWTGALPGAPNFNTGMAGSGQLTFLWNDPQATGVTVNDNTVIYRIGFIVDGSVGESSSVSFTNTPTPIEASQNNGGTIEEIPVVSTTGCVDVTGAGLFGLVLSDEIACTGDTIEVEVSVQNFNDIVSMQYDVQWDNGHLGFIDVTGFNLSGLSGGQFNQLGANMLRIAWVEPTITPQTLPNGTVIYKMRFEVLGGNNTSSDVEFFDNPPLNVVEISQEPGGVLTSYNLTDSKQTVNCSGSPIVVTDTLITNVLCAGESIGAIDISVSGGNGTYSYNWNTTATSQDISGLAVGVYTVTISSGPEFIVESYTVSEATVSNSAAMVSCNGLCDGSIDLNISGYAGGFSYSWNNGLPSQQNQSSLCAGTYFVTITAAGGCTKVEGPIPVTQPAVLSVSGNVTNETGVNMDGAVNISVSGGTTNYTYLWSNSATTQNISGLSQGMYSVTVTDANGCTVTGAYLVEGSMAVIANVTDVSCWGSNDGAISLTVGGGIAPFMYDWSIPGSGPDQNNLFAGSYSVTVTDANGSMVVSSIFVGTPGAITILQANITDETGNGCNGVIDIMVDGGTPPFTYQWSNGETSEDITDLCKGDYSVTIVDDNGCVFLTNTPFTVLPPPLVVANSSQVDVSCYGGDDGSVCINVIGGCAPYELSIPALGYMQTSLTGENVCFDNIPAGNHNVLIQDSGTPTNVIIHAISMDEPDQVLIGVDAIFNNTDPTCNDPNGAINISVSGGTWPYTFLWNNGSTNMNQTDLCHLPPSNPYSVTVTDGNGCTQVLDNISLNLGLSVNVENVTDACFGECDGTIDISVTGGAAPYTYDWGGADPNNLCAGTYGVTVTDAIGNTVEATNITINQPSSALTVTVSSFMNPTENNNDGSVNINVSGGWGGYTYLWSNGATTQNVAGLSAGSHTVTVTDANGCQAFFTQNLSEIGLILSFETVPPSCNGDSDGMIEVMVIGGSGDYSYTWSPNINTQGPLAFGLSAGNYSVTVSDNIIAGLSASDIVPLTEPDPLTITIISTPSSGGATGSLEAVVTGGTRPYDYLWNDDNIQTDSVAVKLSTGEYAVRVEDANGCVEIAQGEVVQGGDCFAAKELLSFNGNGKNTEFIIRCAEQFDNTLKIFNRWGQLVYETTNYDNTWSGIDQEGNDVPAGGYFFVFEYDDGDSNNRIRGSITILR